VINEEVPQPIAKNLQDSEQILYLWQGIPERAHKPFLSERGHRILGLLWMLAFGVFLGWVLFVSDRRGHYLTLIIGVLIGQPLIEKLVRGTYKNLHLSGFPLAAVTNRRVMFFNAKDERIDNIPLNDFFGVSEDYDNGAKIIRLHTGEKEGDVVFYADQTPGILSILNSLVAKGTSS